MAHHPLHNVNVHQSTILKTPKEIKRDLPLTAELVDFVLQARHQVENILKSQDNRLFIVTGPCSIHDEKAALEYAEKLKALAERVADKLFLIMRVYFEKPRTTVGWKGFINDPYLDDSFAIEEGLYKARTLLRNLAAMQLPTATEALDPITPQYLSDLITWSAIGARTTESQTHREMTSGLSMPVGIKNGTDGSLQVAINALKSIESPHAFLGINQQGQVAVIQTRGNSSGHIVLRGGQQPNYDSVNIALCEQALTNAQLQHNIVVDCSHGNSRKNHDLQPLVMHDCIHQILEGNQSIKGLMLESHLHAGNQNVPTDRSQLKYGVSITDACMDWETTEKCILDAYGKLKAIEKEKGP